MLVTRIKVLSELQKKYSDGFGVVELKDNDIYTPIKYRDVLRPAGRYLRVFDNAGSLVEEYRGFVPIEGGTVLWEVD